MPELTEASLFIFFSDFAYDPVRVYGLIVLFMVASSFGFPVPEELVLISAGLMAYMAKDTANFPPPYPGAEGVDTYVLALVCFLSVFLSDLLVFFIGKYFGGKMLRSSFFKSRVKGPVFEKINQWFLKYGSLACGIFRFTLGLRFAGHMSCGLLGISPWKFGLIDGFAALISVPTQIIFVATYGNVVLENIKEFKLFALITLSFLLGVYMIKKVIIKKLSKFRS